MGPSSLLLEIQQGLNRSPGTKLPLFLDLAGSSNRSPTPASPGMCWPQICLSSDSPLSPIPSLLRLRINFPLAGLPAQDHALQGHLFQPPKRPNPPAWSWDLSVGGPELAPNYMSSFFLPYLEAFIIYISSFCCA